MGSFGAILFLHGKDGELFGVWVVEEALGGGLATIEIVLQYGGLGMVAIHQSTQSLF